MLADPDAGVRVRAVGALSRAGGLDDATCAAAAADDDPSVRRRLAEELGRSAGRIASGGDQAPDDQRSKVRLPSGAARTLLSLLGDDEPLVAEAAAWALGEVLGPVDDPAAGVDDDPAETVEDDPATQVVDDPANRVVDARRAEAVAALGASARDHEDPLVREASVAALGALGDAAALDTVLAATTDKPAVRRRAVIALAAFLGDAGVDEALRQALQDRDWQVRQAAEMLLDEDRHAP
jgi:HEAT repeat protein